MTLDMNYYNILNNIKILIINLYNTVSSFISPIINDHIKVYHGICYIIAIITCIIICHELYIMPKHLPSKNDTFYKDKNSNGEYKYPWRYRFIIKFFFNKESYSMISSFVTSIALISTIFIRKIVLINELSRWISFIWSITIVCLMYSFFTDIDADRLGNKEEKFTMGRNDSSTFKKYSKRIFILILILIFISFFIVK